MSWIEKLSETYENAIRNPESGSGGTQLLPTEHTLKQAHVQIYLDSKGNFLPNRAKVIPKLETIIPATEKSATRTTNDAPHGLCDKIQYCAKDYSGFGGLKKPYFSSYIDQLGGWEKSAFSHPTVASVLLYVLKGTLVADLVREKILHIDADGKLLTEWKSGLPKPEIFKYVINDQGDAFVRWVVEVPGNPVSECWNDSSLFRAWSQLVLSKETESGLCIVSGKETALAVKHPARIRNSADGAKMISSNDLEGFTFLGRFATAREAVGVGAEVSQKAHSALRWLIGRKQAFKNGDQVIVSWAVSGVDVPSPLSNSYDLFADENDISVRPAFSEGDAGQGFARRLSKFIAGYSAKLGATNSVVVLGLDSASPGRLSITFYRELTGSDFLRMLENWHSDLAWEQRLLVEDGTDKKKSTVIRFICAPAPKDIAFSAYGPRVDDKLKKATVERLLPCIIDGLPIPRDLVDSVVHRATNRVGFKKQFEWEAVLGVACAIYKGYYLRNHQEKRSYSMALEVDRKTRDYLFGRLLAAADGLEHYALSLERVGKKEDTRQTNAGRLMQRFAERPSSAWRTIELSLRPYIARLGNRAARYNRTITEVTASFDHDDFVSDKALTGEFLLGYHCQRQAFFDANRAPTETEIETETL